MITYTQMYQRVADNCGFRSDIASQSLTNAKSDLNTALRNFKNGSRRYWTRKEVTTNLVANQQFYTFPEDMVRITTVKVVNGGFQLPITMIDSEEKWNRLNIIPSITVAYPTSGFIRGRNELGLYPIPSVNLSNGLVVSYESRMRDMSIDDYTTIVVNVTNASNVVTAYTGTPFVANMVGMWINITDATGDGNWYQIAGFTDTSHLTLENYYQGQTGTNLASTIALVPDIPEDFHPALINYACYMYELKRGGDARAANYKSLYDEAMRNYISRYAAKTTGVVQDSMGDFQYNIFNLPPSGFSI